MMKKVITMLLLGVTILSTVILGGCGKSDATISKAKTPYAIVKEKGADGQYVVESYLTEQNPNVVKVKETVEGYIKAYSTIDFKTTDGMGTYGYINDNMLQELKSKNDAAETVKFYKDNSLITQFDSVKIDTVNINKDMNLAEIKGSFTYKYLDGTNTFFKNSNKQKGSTYKSNFTMQIVKQNDIWKVSFEKTETATPVSK